MRCPACQSIDLKVVSTTPDPDSSEIRRRRECLDCGHRFTTIERIRATLPLVVKASGQEGVPPRKQPFDAEKLRRGIETALAKRPIPPSAIDRLIDQIEFELASTGRDEVPSRMIGELVIKGLRELDQVAYLRYAIVFLGLENLADVKTEVDRLLSEHSGVTQRDDRKGRKK